MNAWSKRLAIAVVLFGLAAPLLGRSGLKVSRTFAACLPASILPSNPKLAAFISGSQNSMGVLKFSVSRYACW